MLSKEDNDVLTQTDRGTPMGELFRRYWLPVVLTEEVPLPNCYPVRTRILGEDLVAFRDSNGKVGLVDAYCPHRGAPMRFARNEQGGLRCIYHGWKFSTDGTCLDMPNIANGETVRHRMRTIAYPTFEGAGMVWAYLGPPERQPPVPRFPFIDLPATHWYVTKYQLDCNWFQAQEGDYDPSHQQFLHSAFGARQADRAKRRNDYSESIDAGRGTRVLAHMPLSADTPVGLVHVSAQPLGDGTMAVRASHAIMPSFIPAGRGGGSGVFPANIRVPMDDEHEWHFRLRWSREPLSDEELSNYRYAGNTYSEHEAGSWRPKANKDNDYLQDHLLQRYFNFSGVSDLQVQDVMVLEDQWGPIADRTREHLVAADLGLVHMRNRLLTMARNLSEGNEPEEPFLLGERAVVQTLPSPIPDVPLADELDDETVQQIMRGLETVQVSDYGQAADTRSLRELAEATWAGEPDLLTDPGAARVISWNPADNA